MKKVFPVLILAFAFAFSAQAFSMNDIYWYLPNRVADFTDIVSVDVGLCAGLKAEARVTRAVDFSFGGGCFWLLRKDYNRYLEATLEKGYHFNFLCVGVEDHSVDAACGMQPWFFPQDEEKADVARRYIDYCYQGFPPSPVDGEYDMQTGSRDWWEIAAEVGCGLYGRLAVHPVEIADFVAGIFFVDFKHDDVSFD